MAERTIKHKAFTYSVDTGEKDANGNPLLLERLARRGDTVDLRDEDIKRGERFDAFESEADTTIDTDAGDVEVRDATVEQLVEWLEEEGPTVQQVIDASEGDPEVARRLLDAETQASGGDPRKGVVDGLGAVIERGNQ